jgi:hypothetical protein
LFARLGALSEGQFSTIGRAIEELSPGASYASTAGAFESALVGLGVDGEELLSAVLSLHSLHATHGWSLDDIADSVSGSDRVDVDNEQTRSNLRERLRSFLANQTLRDLSKATELTAEREHLFHLSRIITDIRPVFADDPMEKPEAAVVIHTLRLQYFDTNDGQSRTFEIALSRQDVRTLEDTCKRALAKHLTITPLINDSGLLEIDTQAD